MTTMKLIESAMLAAFTTASAAAPCTAGVSAAKDAWGEDMLVLSNRFGRLELSLRLSLIHI